MDAFLKMDIFFVVTTAAVAITTILLALVLMRVLRILKNIEGISTMVEEEGKQLRADIAQVRTRVKEEGMRMTHLFDFLGAAKKPRRRQKKSEPTN